VVAPKAILVLAATTVVRGRFRDRRLAVVVTFGLLCQLQALTRADYTHQAQAALPGLIALGTAWPNVFALESHAASAGRRLAAAAGFSASVLLAAFLLIFAVASASVAEPNTLSKDDQALFAAVRTVQMNSQRDDPIFVGLTGHRHTFINDMIVYYLANRRPAVRVAMFNPGVTNTTSVQQEMVDDLAESKAPIVVADSRWTDLSETSNDSFTPGATVLDDFLSKTYIPACEFGSFTVLTTSDRVGTTTCAALRPDSMVDALAAVAGR
jgi:hypothetical protein